MNDDRKKILIVEDEEKIASVVLSFLENKSYSVLWAKDGKEAIDMFEKENVTLILLDLMLPIISGEEVCRLIRKKSRVPIIMLTAKSDEADMLNGLGIGADDYITKPFSLKALHARIEAVLRRSSEDVEALTNYYSYNQGDLSVDFVSRTVMKRTGEVKLTPNEYKILTTMIKYPNKVFTRDELISIAFGDEFEGYDRTIDSHIKNLRQKIEIDPKKPIYVKTIHGVGYKFGGDIEQ